METTYLAGILERDVASVQAMPGRSIHDSQKLVGEQGSNAVTVPVQQHAPKIKNESFEFGCHHGKAAYSKSQWIPNAAWTRERRWLPLIDAIEKTSRSRRLRYVDELNHIILHFDPCFDNIGDATTRNTAPGEGFSVALHPEEHLQTN